jgi:predicted MFS family arabinose efflux permease
MVTVYALAYALLSPVVGAAAAHWPRKRLLLAGLAVFVVGNVVTAVAPSIELVLASRLVAAFGAAMFSPTAAATGGISGGARTARPRAGLLLLWGVAATVGNLAAGRLTDHFGSRRIINAAIALAALDFALLPWSSASLATAIPALVVWGACAWGFVVPQQHRLIGITPGAAPLLVGLNSTALYMGVSLSGIIGGAAITWFDRYALGPVGAICIAVALVTAEWAQRRMARVVDGSNPTAAIQTATR